MTFASQPRHTTFTVRSSDRFVVAGGSGSSRSPTLVSPLGSEGINDSGDALVFAEVDARMELDGDWDSGYGVEIGASGCTCEVGSVGVSVLPSG